MSLVHQVLKDIDQRKDPQSIEVPLALQMPAERKADNHKFALISAGIALVIGLTAWLYWQQEEDAKPAVAESKPQTVSASRPEQAVPDVTSDKKEDAATNFPESEIAERQVKPLESQPEAIAGVIERPVVEEGSHLQISRRDQSHQQLYVDILADMKARQWQSALDNAEKLRAEPGLSVELKEKLLHNQLRIYLEQKRFEDFLGFYQQNQHQTSVAWLSTAAPGLHMIGSYQPAISSYQKLIAEQPAVSNWPIAMALALEQSQQHQAAEKTLQRLLRQYSLEPQQRVWVEQKLASLSSGSR